MQQRKEGNEVFKTATGDLAASIQQQRLLKAAALYNQAYAASTTPKDKASACKNLGQTHWKLANECLPRFEETSEQEVVDQLVDSYRGFAWAVEHGKQDQDQVWLEDVVARMRTITTHEATKGNLKFFIKVGPVHVTYRPVAELAFDLNLTAAEQMVGLSARCLENADVRGSSRWLAELNPHIVHLNRALRLLDLVFQGDRFDSGKDIEDTIFFQQCRTDSFKSFSAAQEMQERLLTQDTDFNLDMAYAVIDKFKESAMLSREKDLEMEAKALSELAQLFHRVFHNDSIANKYCVTVIQLAHALSPRSFTSQIWYSRARDFIEEYRRKRAREEHEQREEILKEFKPQLDEIRAASEESAEKLLDVLYTKYKPAKFSQAQKPEVGNLKKALKEALRHFHSDKHQELKWELFYHEISAMLNAHFSSIKLGSTS